MNSKIPNWLLVVVGALYRFIVGAFGVSLSHPYSTSFCAPFWLTVVGMTVGLPVVLLGWIIRLIFGRGRAQWLGRILTTKPCKIIGLIVLIGLVGLFFYALFAVYGWIGPVVLLGVIIGIGGLIFGISLFIEWRENKKQSKPFQEPVPVQEKKVSPVIRGFIRFLKVIVWLPKIILMGIWDIICVIALMIYAVYKKFCPYVAFP